MDPIIKLSVVFAVFALGMVAFVAVAVIWAKRTTRFVAGLERRIGGRLSEADQESTVVGEVKIETDPTAKGTPPISIKQEQHHHHDSAPPWRFILGIVGLIFGLTLVGLLGAYVLKGGERVPDQAKEFAGVGFNSAGRLNCRTDCTPQVGFDDVPRPAPKNEDGYIVIKGARCVGTDSRCGSSCFPRCENLASVPPDPACWCDSERLRAD